MPSLLGATVIMGAFTSALAGSNWTAASTAATDALYLASLANLEAVVNNGSLADYLGTMNVTQECTLENAVVRKDYLALTDAERLAYSNAVTCLFSKDPVTPLSASNGTRSRYDDFVATHINQTMTIHQTGNFLYWHRYFIHTFETALRDECGYEGYLPYWNWGKAAHDLRGSPFFDGTDYSQGGNGIFALHNASCAIPTCLMTLEPGVGGGCVTTGPYANMVVNISNSATTFGCPDGADCFIPAGEFLGYQPRCLRRDVSNQYGTQWASDNNTAALLSDPTYSSDIGSFQSQLQNTGTTTEGYFGLHSYGHLTINGDSSDDFYNSPNEPMFWLHHAQVDRVFTTWQNLAPLERTLTISGGRYFLNEEDLGDATLEDTMNLGFIDNFDGGAIKEHASTVGGKYCYIYE